VWFFNYALGVLDERKGTIQKDKEPRLIQAA